MASWPQQILRETQLMAQHRQYEISHVEVQHSPYSRSFRVSYDIGGRTKTFEISDDVTDLEQRLTVIARQFPFSEVWADPVC